MGVLVVAVVQEIIIIAFMVEVQVEAIRVAAAVVVHQLHLIEVVVVDPIVAINQMESVM